MKGLSKGDFSASVQRSGIGGAIASSQVLEAVKMYIAGELECTPDQLMPVSLRHSVLVIRSAHPGYSKKLQQKEEELFSYIYSSFNIQLNRIQFII